MRNTLTIENTEFIVHACNYQVCVLLAVTAGPDSWLVRPSDTTEGDFSIFFYCNTAVQRFKIHKSGHQYSMGGRYFDRSVSAVTVQCCDEFHCSSKDSNIVQQ